MKPARLMISAGEASGDMYGGRLITSIKSLRPNMEFFGIGGDAMASSGMRLITHIRDLSVMGFWEVIKDLRRIKRIQSNALNELKHLKPDGLVLIDFYKFNIGLAKAAKEMGIPVVYYVPPKLWVWGKWRIQTLKKYIDQILAIFPFEESFYRSQDVPVAFVGNPLLEILDNHNTDNIDEFKSRYSIYSNEDTFVGLLPGSRLAEIQRMLPIFLEASQLISREVPGTVRFLMPLAHTIDRSIVEKILDDSPVVVVLVEGEAQNVLKIADVSLVASGTATLEAFLLGAPQVVAYRTSWFTYILGSRIINVPRVSLPNILTGKDVVVELLQDQVIPERLARYALEMLESSDRRDAYLEAAIEVRNNLGKGNASLAAAQATLSVCGL